ncbi:MAG: RluA family pseudouridine synthase [Balneolales bacterium]|nr:RluA family pseudouridine synthase [Balneolales bacterium]
MSDTGKKDPYEKVPQLIELRVASGQNTPVRIDRYLTEMVQNATRSKVQKAIAENRVLVNGHPTKPAYIVQPGDEIRVEVLKPQKPELEPEDIPLDIIHEDDSLLVINKPADMVVHPAFGNWTGTMVHALLHHAGDELSATGQKDDRPGIVHRIDKGTSGLLVVAKNDFAHQYLARQFADHSIQRTYQAIVWGRPEEKGSFDGRIGRSTKDRKLMAVLDGDRGKRAVTHYKILEHFDYLSLVEIQLETGRTHQIRVHFSHAGHPLLADETYGGASVRFGSNTGFRKTMFEKIFSLMGRQCLHAKTLGFNHPENGKPVLYDSPLPADFQESLDQLRTYCKD